ncbi:MAG: DUF5916 domain-containing protein [Myxococcota bacterium]
MPPLAPELTVAWRDHAGIVVDGRGDEAVWAEASALPDPAPHRPATDVAPVGSVETRLAADAHGLYAWFVVRDPDPAAVRAGIGRRDGRALDDAVGLLVDPRGDGRRAYLFACNPLGVQLDRLHVPEEDDDDLSWDAAWSCAARATDTGWEVEMAIPWAAARMGGEVDRFGVVVLRELARRGHSYAWPPVDAGTDPLLAAAAVRGLGRLPPRVGLDLLPELTYVWADPPVASARPAIAGVSAGGTARWTPGGPVSAVATVNPDFSQLESDATQIETNARYALYYDEKRPFFLEGQDWFAHPFSSVVHTRTIAAPLYGVRAAVEGERGGVAALHALDLAPPPSVNEGGGWTAEDLDGHSALATLARARVGLGGDAYLGVLASDRTIVGTDLGNRVVGADARLRLEKRAWVDVAALGSSSVLTPGGPIENATATRLDAHWSGRTLWLHLRAESIAPGFRQENGFFTMEDRQGALIEGNYSLYPDAAWLPRVSLEPLDLRAWTRFDGTPRERAWDPSAWAFFGNGGFGKIDVAIAGEEFAGEWIDYVLPEAYVYVPFGEALRVDLGAGVGTAPYYDPDDPRAGAVAGAWAEIAVQPSPRLELGLSPGFEHMREVAGEPLYTSWVARARAQLHLTRSGWVRLVGERTVDDAAVGWLVEPVAAWEWSPGRAVYLGGSYADDGRWQAFGKLGWSFSL